MAGIYVSWPFCAQKCTYCNFASGVQPKELEREYLRALLAEIAAHKWQWQPETVYVGGGTPSALDPAALARIFNALPGRPWREAAVEAAPGSFSRDAVECWRAAGVNRVSLGVQSFNRTELARTGRKHTAEVVGNDVDTLRSVGIFNISIDLIAGLAGQTWDSWRSSVTSAIQLGVPHVSVYMLEVDEDSRLGSEILLGGKRYGAADIPTDDRIADFYEFAVDELSANGLQRYEISNFARPGFESLHNLKYWRRQPYIGFGSDAHSFDGASRRQNVETARAYVEHFRQGISCGEATSLPDPDEEKFFVGLRLAEGVIADEADWLRFGPAFRRFLDAGVLERKGDALALTPRGVMISNEVFQEFITA